MGHCLVYRAVVLCRRKAFRKPQAQWHTLETYSKALGGGTEGRKTKEKTKYQEILPKLRNFKNNYFQPNNHSESFR